LAGLSEEASSELSAAIGSSKPVLNPKKMASRIGTSVPSISAEDLTKILSALFSLSAVRVLNRVPIPEFLDDVCESLHAKKNDSNSRALRSRLEQLLQADSVLLASKASAIQREHSHVLMSARVLTDIRPVFGEGPESFQAAIVTHSLKLTSIHSNQVQESFFALDDDDLIMLQKTIARAEAKSKTLRAFIESSGLPNLESDED
jgi:hypothetical protein